jgi:hypothetical protein
LLLALCALGLIAFTRAGLHQINKGAIAAGSGLARNAGDYISCNASPGGLDTYYSFWIEVPSGVSQLGVDIFDADVGGSWDQNTDAWNTTVRYSLRDPTNVERDYLLLGEDPASDNQQNKELYVDGPIAAGHWEFRVDMSSAVTSGDDINYFEIRAFTRELLESYDFEDDPGWTQFSGLWERGVPLGLSGDPDNQSSGNNVFGYNLGTHDSDGDSFPDGLYEDDLSQEEQLTSTAIDCSGRFDILVRYRRWLGVHSSDSAIFKVWDSGVSDFVDIWDNDGDAISDTQWILASFDISINADDSPDLQLQWGLDSDDDGNVSYGWNIDDVEIWANDPDFNLNIYAESYVANGNTADTDPDYYYYPYVTCGCIGYTNDFDGDDDATILLQTRTNRALTFSPTVSGDDEWEDNLFSAWTQDISANEYGLWSATLTLGDGNLVTFYLGQDTASAPPPTEQPEADTFRIYLPSGEDPDYDPIPPVKPHVSQAITMVTDGNPPAVGANTYLEVTVTVTNPTVYPITFSSANQVEAYVPGNLSSDQDGYGDVVYIDGFTSVSAGTITEEPDHEAAGSLRWNPGIVAGGEIETLKYWVRATPSASNRLRITGKPGANGTTATFVDETGNTTQARATFTFGPLCELAITPGVSLGGVPTRALVGGMTATRLNDQSYISWTTAGETGTAAFRLYRWDPASRVWQPVSGAPVPGMVDAPQGGIYRLTDPEAMPGQTYQYRIEELDVHGRTLKHGPFTITIPVVEANSGSIPNQSAMSRSDRTPHLRVRLGADSSGSVAVTMKTTDPSKSSSVVERPSAAKLAVMADGLHAISYDVLADALNMPPAAVEALAVRGRLEITSGGRLITYLANAVPDSLAFYGEGLDSAYSDHNVYRVAIGRGQLMAWANDERPAATANGLVFPTTQDAEEDHLSAPAVTNDPESDYWFWDYLFAGHPSLGMKSFAVDTPAPAGTGAAALTVRLHGGSDTMAAADHHVAVRLNGTLIGTGRWDGLSAKALRFTIDPKLLHDGANTVELTALLQEGVLYSLVYVDGFAVDYTRRARADGDRLRLRLPGLPSPVATVDGFTREDILVLDITDPAAPVVQPAAVDRAAGSWRVTFRPVARRDYLAVSWGAATPVTDATPDYPSRLRDAGQAADYVVIAPRALGAPAEALAAYRAKTGLRTLVADLEDVYDEFNYGRPSPHAIRDFLAWAYTHWAVPPRYAVLAGRGTLDYRDRQGYGGNLLPPVYAGTPHGLTAADMRYGCVAGDDNIPEIAVGRLPATTAAELQAMVDKIIAYEKQSAGAWALRALVVADDPDPAGDFPADSEAIAAELPPRLQLERIYLPEQSPDDARAALIDGIAAGTYLVNYLGHGGVDRLAAEGLLRLDDIAKLDNGARLPLLLAFTCAVGECTIPGYPGLGEALLAHPGGGAVAVYAPAGLSDNAAAAELNAALAAVLRSGGAATLGDAVRAALAAWEPAHPTAAFHRDLYFLLGDPALRLKR